MTQIITEEYIFEAAASFNVLPREFINKLGFGTPSVQNICHFTVSGGSISNFLNGAEGQKIYVLGDGNTTIENGLGIYTNTGANKTLSTNVVYQFTRFNNNWYESASGSGTGTVTAPDYSYLTDGQLVYHDAITNGFQSASLSGVSNRIDITGAPNALVIDISATYAGQSSIITLGTITSGVWSGTSISTTYTDAKVISVFGRSGIITAAANDYSFAQLSGIPTTISGYGITDFNSLGDARWSLLGHTHSASDITAGTFPGASYSFGASPVSMGALTATSGVISAAAAIASVALSSVGGSGRSWELRSLTDGRFMLFDATAATGRVEVSSTGAWDFEGNAVTMGALTATSATLGTITSSLWNGTSIGTAYTDAKVTSVASRTGAITLTAADIAAGTFPAGNFVFPDGYVISINNTPNGSFLFRPAGTASLANAYEFGAGAHTWYDANGSQLVQLTLGAGVIAGSLKTSNPISGTAQPWKFGNIITGQVGLVLLTTQYIELDVNGTLYKLATV